MFDDKELLNIILYEKRFATYCVCLAMIVAGVLLGLVRVSDETVREAYNNKYPQIVWTDKSDILKNIELVREGKDCYVINRTDKDILGIYFDNDIYEKGVFEKNIKVRVNNAEKITGCVFNEQKAGQ